MKKDHVRNIHWVPKNRICFWSLISTKEATHLFKDKTQFTLYFLQFVLRATMLAEYCPADLETTSMTFSFTNFSKMRLFHAVHRTREDQRFLMKYRTYFWHSINPGVPMQAPRLAKVEKCSKGYVPVLKLASTLTLPKARPYFWFQ